jgi:glutathione S-transferase
MHELLGLPYSPWTEKARWALDVRQVPYTFRHYQPLVGEPALRVKLRRLRGRITVPVLTTDDGRVLGDSMAIARWSDAHGKGPRLFPEEHDAAIARFVALSERGLAAGRMLTLERMLADREALTEMVPRPLRRRLGGLGVRIARTGIARTIRKYDSGASVDARATLTAALDEIRVAIGLASSPGPGTPRTLLGALTFADLAVAQVLISVQPPASGLKMGAGSRRCFAEPGLLDRYRDLVAWRDDLYRAFRGGETPSPSQ